VLESAKWIAENSEQVLIGSPHAISQAAATILNSSSSSSSLPSSSPSISSWRSHPLHPKSLDSTSVDWLISLSFHFISVPFLPFPWVFHFFFFLNNPCQRIFVVDSLNFSFWSDHQNPYSVSFEGLIQIIILLIIS